MTFSDTLRFVLVFGLCAGLLSLGGCDLDSRLADVNKDPQSIADPNPDFQFTTYQLKESGRRFEQWRGNLIYSAAMSQQFASLLWPGGKYDYTFSPAYSGAYFERRYGGSVKEIVDIVNQTSDAEADVNKNAVARIMRVFTFHRLTDMYGDVPYSEAGKAFLSGNGQPTYDQQEDIYLGENGLLNELEAAIGQFDSSQPTFGDSDLMYGGNIDQWRRFANSLMLRLALRMVNVNNGAAQDWAQKAIDGGVMQSNNDIAYIPHTGGPNGINKNGNGEVFTFLDNWWLSQTFVDWMKARDDPRITAYGQLPSPGAEAIGMPNGYDNDDDVPIQEHSSWVDCSSNPDPCGLTAYLRVNDALKGEDDPMFFQTYAEVELMLAEAEVRWGIAPNSASQHYENGVRAAMEYLSMYGDAAAVADAEITEYLNENPFDSSGSMEDKIRQINNQYWAATVMNAYEAFINYRRVGYPELEPAPVDRQEPHPDNDSNGEIPKRFIYPQAEAVDNAENYREAVGRLEDGDSFNSSMWWDTE